MQLLKKSRENNLDLRVIEIPTHVEVGIARLRPWRLMEPMCVACSSFPKSTCRRRLGGSSASHVIPVFREFVTAIYPSQGRRKRQGIGPANTPKQLINYSYFVLRMRRHPPAYMTINNQRQEYINNHLCKMRRQYVAIYSSSEFPKLTEAMFTTSNKLITNCINVELVYFLLIEVEQQ